MRGPRVQSPPRSFFNSRGPCPLLRTSLARGDPFAPLRSRGSLAALVRASSVALLLNARTRKTDLSLWQPQRLARSRDLVRQHFKKRSSSPVIAASSPPSRRSSRSHLAPGWSSGCGRFNCENIEWLRRDDRQGRQLRPRDTTRVGWPNPVPAPPSDRRPL